MLPESQRHSRLTGNERRQLKGSIKARTYTQPLKMHPEKTKKKCSATGKIKWLTELDAKIAIGNRDVARGSNCQRNGHSEHEVRVYQCPECDHWHTTHLREYREPREQPIPIKRAKPKGPHPAHKAVSCGDPQAMAG